MDTSIIIPTFNRSRYLALLLQSIAQQTILPGQVIIVDDNSTDSTDSMVQDCKVRSAFEIIYMKLDKKAFQGAARNIGAEIASGDTLIFIDDDVILPREFIERHLSQHDSGVVLGRVLGYGTVHKYTFEQIKQMMVTGLEGLEELPDFRDGNDLVQLSPWEFFVASNLSIRRDIFLKFQFDDEFKGWGEEDTEFGYRISCAGIKIRYTEECFCYAIGDATPGADGFYTAERVTSLIRNLLLFYKKHQNETIREYLHDRFSGIPYKYINALIAEKYPPFLEINQLVLQVPVDGRFASSVLINYPEFNKCIYSDMLLLQAIDSLRKKFKVILASSNLPYLHLYRYFHRKDINGIFDEYIQLGGHDLQLSGPYRYDMILQPASLPCPPDYHVVRNFKLLSLGILARDDAISPGGIKEIEAMLASLDAKGIEIDPVGKAGFQGGQDRMQTRSAFTKEVAIFTRFENQDSAALLSELHQEFPDLKVHMIFQLITQGSLDLCAAFVKGKRNAYIHINLDADSRMNLIRRLRYAVFDGCFEYIPECLSLGLVVQSTSGMGLLPKEEIFADASGLKANIRSFENSAFDYIRFSKSNISLTKK